MWPSNCSGCNESLHNSTANNSTANGTSNGTAAADDALPPQFHASVTWTRLVVLLVAAAIAIVIVGALCGCGRRRGWRAWLARRPLFRSEDVQLTELGDWMAADTGEDVTIGGPLSRIRQSNGQGQSGLPQGIFATPQKDDSAEYFDLATPR
uniref:Uncharacterized protein n=1 Tax=Alexandrium catenella TaxID=2925 RepID=A0A7S1RNG1_ALECA|mmetsp:Transcript_65356/g.174162  ORF Transcript_65356/g.174162 Transcript_65356/m.174162 type:complete len:152 (+) Transcript_65356:55-510(+)